MAAVAGGRQMNEPKMIIMQPWFRFLWTGALVLFLLSSRPILNLGHVFSGAQEQIEQLSSQANDAQKRGDYREAAEKYAAILRLRPDALEVRVNLGLMHHLLGEPSEAVRDFELVLLDKPQLYVANLFLGVDLLQLHQPRQALTYLERAQRLNPKDAEPAVHLGQAYFDLHEFRKANDWYRRATEINPANAEAWYGLGITYLRLAREASDQLVKEGRGSGYARRLYAESLDERGWIADAISAYQRLLDSPSPPPCSRAELGFVYLVQADEALIPAASKQFEEALKGDPGCLLARLGAARIQFQQKDTTSAWEELTSVWRADPNFFRAHSSQLWRGFGPERLNNFEETIRQLPASPSEPPVTRLLLMSIETWQKQGGDTFISTADSSSDTTVLDESPPENGQATPAQLCGQGHYTRCAQTLKPKLTQLAPDALLLLATCSFASGDYRLGFDAASQLLRTNPHSLAGLYWQATVGQRLAVGALTHAALADPNSPRIHLLIAEAYRDKESFKEAEAEYSRVLQLEPNYAPAHLGLGMVYWQDHKYEEAIPHLQAVLAQRPGDPESSYVWGAILVARHQFAEAMPYLDSALQGTNSIFPYVHALRSQVFAAQGQTETAIAELKQSLEVDVSGSYHFQLYQLFKKIGDEEAAQTALQQSEALRKRQDSTREGPADGPP